MSESEELRRKVEEMQREQERRKRNLYGEDSVHPGLLKDFAEVKADVHDMKGTVEGMPSAKNEQDRVLRWGGEIAAAVVTGLLAAIISQLATPG